MHDVIKQVIEGLKLGPRQLVAIACASAFLLFAPGQWLKALGVYGMANDYRPVFGIALILSACLLVALVGSKAGRLGLFGVNKWVTKRILRQRLRGLTDDEKHVLGLYVVNQTRSQVFRLDDGVVQGLVHAGILYRAAEIGSAITGFPYNVTETAWQVLHEQGWL